MSFFDDLLAAVRDGVATLVTAEIGGLLDQAQADAAAFVIDSRDALERWGRLRAEDQITNREFADLVQARVALAQMAALTQAGIALTRLDRFKAGLSQVIISSAFKALGV